MPPPPSAHWPSLSISQGLQSPESGGPGFEVSPSLAAQCTVAGGAGHGGTGALGEASHGQSAQCTSAGEGGGGGHGDQRDTICTSAVPSGEGAVLSAAGETAQLRYARTPSEPPPNSTRWRLIIHCHCLTTRPPSVGDPPWSGMHHQAPFGLTLSDIVERCGGRDAGGCG